MLPLLAKKEVRKIIDSDLVIQRAYEALNRFNWSEIELRTYEKEIKRIMDNQAVEDYMKENTRQEGERIGIEKGIEKGIDKSKIEIAKSMLQAGEPIDKIIRFTGLSESDIRQLV